MTKKILNRGNEIYELRNYTTCLEIVVLGKCLYYDADKILLNLANYHASQYQYFHNKDQAKKGIYEKIQQKEKELSELKFIHKCLKRTKTKIINSHKIGD